MAEANLPEENESLIGEDPTMDNLFSLAEELEMSDIFTLSTALSMPKVLSEVECSIDFLQAIKQWEQHKPFKFYEVLQVVRYDLIAIACGIPWLCVSEDNESDCGEILNMQTFLVLLKTEIKLNNWKLIVMYIGKSSGKTVSFESTMKLLIIKGYIKKSLFDLTLLMKKIRREDVAKKLEKYKTIFSVMDKDEFIRELEKELLLQSITEEQIENWAKTNKELLYNNCNKLKEMVDEEQVVLFEEAYIDLTILQLDFNSKAADEELALNQLSLLTKKADKDFGQYILFCEELTYISSNPGIYYFTGNSGCGKSILCNKAVLMYCKNSLKNIFYCIYIQFSNPIWNLIEERDETHDDILKDWISTNNPELCDPKRLAGYLIKQNGDGLLLIIDDLDEFCTNVKSDHTFLFKILSRKVLTQSTIIYTSQPCFCPPKPTKLYEVSSNICQQYYILGFSPKDRDLYFQKHNLDKEKESLMICSEISQLSLIPVNASLFASLLRSKFLNEIQQYSEIELLTQLRHELTCYLIRRKLEQMIRKGVFLKENQEEMYSCMVDCLYNIFIKSYQGEEGLFETIKSVPLRIKDRLSSGTSILYRQRK